jgi:TonB-linked SusC/RagA family outer membrane protein
VIALPFHPIFDSITCTQANYITHKHFMRNNLLVTFSLMLIVMSQAWAQTRTVTGKVTDAATGQGLAGVTILAEGTSVGTSTNTAGQYFLVVPANVTTLAFSFIGYTTVERTLDNAATIHVGLVAHVNQLQEVSVQVPYGTVAKTAFTGSEATITSTAIQKQQVTSVTRVLEGLVPGIQTTNGGGAPGSGASVRIRGIGSVNASSSPLYVVDGIPFDGTLASISTDDIETLTVLKDAAASALYGSRAANGVIMITTRRGKKGKPAVAINVRSGVSERGIPEYERVSPQEFYEMTWESLRNANLVAKNPATNATYTPAEAGLAASNIVASSDGLAYNPFNVAPNQVIDPATGKLNPNAQLLYHDDWSKVLFQQATRTDLNLNVSGAGDNNDYLFSLGYLKENGTAKFSDYDRLSARVKANTTVNSWLKAGINLSGALADLNGSFATGVANANPFYYSRFIGPVYPVWQRDASGNFVTDPATGDRVPDWGLARPFGPNSNLLSSLDLDDRGSKRSEATANTFAEMKFLRDFTFRTTIGGSFYQNLATTFQNSLFGDAASVAGRSTKADTRQLAYTFNQVLSWNRKFGDHGFTALAGHENYDYEYNFLNATRTGFPFPGTNEIASAATLTGATSYTNQLRIESYFSNLSYDFREKYLLSASFRTDGSSRFYQEARWGNFWSVGGGWRISRESFLRGLNWLDELKLKASYGQQGNEDILGTDGSSNYYAWQGLYSLGANNGTAPGALFGQFPVQELQWEKNTSGNVGADFRLFNKLEGTLEWYNRISDNLLFNVPLAPSTGVSIIPKNIGAMKNTGIELQLGYNAIATDDFDYRIDVNLARNKNKITRLPASQQEIIIGAAKLMEGKSIYDFWLREYAGVNPDNGDALYYMDTKGADGQVTGRTTTNDTRLATLYYHDSALPGLTGGITNSVRYKGFDFSVLVTGQAGGKFYDENHAGLMHRGTLGTHWSKDILNRWQKPGDITKVPRLQRGIANNDSPSSRWLYDASFLTVKNMNLGYTLPKTVTSKAGMHGLRAFVAADNAFIFTKNKGMDPQQAFNGRSDYAYPIFRTFTLGLNASF